MTKLLLTSWLLATAICVADPAADYRKAIIAAARQYRERLKQIPATDKDHAEILAELKRLERLIAATPQTTLTGNPVATSGTPPATPATTVVLPKAVKPVGITHTVAYGHKQGKDNLWIETDESMGSIFVRFKLPAVATTYRLLMRTSNLPDAQSGAGFYVYCAGRKLAEMTSVGRNAAIDLPLAVPLSGDCLLLITGRGTDGLAIATNSIRLQPPGVAAKPATKPDAKLILNETFDDNDAAWQRWTSNGLTKSIHNGWAAFFGGDHNGFFSKKKFPVDNVVIEFRGIAKNNGFHCHFSPYNVNFGSYSNTECAAGIYPKYFHRVDLKPSYKRGVAQVFRIESDHGTLRGFIDGKKVVEYKVPGTRPTPPHCFGFTAYSSELKIDWIRIRKLK